MEKREIIISICLLLIIIFMTFLPSLRNDFTNWDDSLYVTKNPKIKELSWEGVRTIFTSTHYGGYEPLTELSFAVEYHFCRLNPRIYHATNLLFHLLNCLLVFWLIFLLSRRLEVSFITALLFGIHPLRLESVAWITERKDVLYAFFFLGSLIAYLFYLRKKAVRYYCLSLLLFFISLLPKAQGLFLPFVLLLFDYFRGRKFDRKNLLEKAPFFLISAVFAVITFAGQSTAGCLGREELVMRIPKLLDGAYVLVFYLIKSATPVRLSCLYPYPESGGGTPFLLLFSPFILTTVTIGAIFSGRYGKKLIFGSLFYLINLLIVLQLVRTGPAIVADRYTYIPSIGLFYLVAEGLLWLKSKYAKIAGYLLPVSLVVITALLSSLTWQRCPVWKNSETLWSDVLKKYRGLPHAHNNLGLVYFQRGEIDEAIECYRRALNHDPDYVEAHLNLGNARARQKRFEEAVRCYLRALEKKPDLGNAYGNLGAAFFELGELEKARRSLEKSLQLNPLSYVAHNNMGNIYFRMKELDQAVEHYQKALRLNPDLAKLHNNLGLALAGQGKLKEAASHYCEALRLEPDYVKAHNNLGNLFFRQGRFREAVVSYRKSLELKPDFYEAAINLSAALIKAGRYNEALHTLRARLRADPRDLRAAADLARFLATCPDPDFRNEKEAVELAESLCYEETDYRDPVALDTLAAVYAEVGRFEDAVRLAEKAREAARAQGNSALAGELENCLSDYRAR